MIQLNISDILDDSENIYIYIDYDKKDNSLSKCWCHLYNHSAFAFLLLIKKEYKPLLNFSYVLGIQIKIGIPANILMKYININEEQFKSLSSPIVINLKSHNIDIDFSNYENWIQSIVDKNKINQQYFKIDKKELSKIGVEQYIIKELNNFNISDKSPIECLNFIMQLKNLIRIKK